MPSPARALGPTSHSLMRSEMPPSEGGALCPFPADAEVSEHWPSALTRSAAVNRRSRLDPADQSDVVARGSALGTRVTLFKLKSAEHAAMPTASVVNNAIRKGARYGRCAGKLAASVAANADRHAK